MRQFQTAALAVLCTGFLLASCSTEPERPAPTPESPELAPRPSLGVAGSTPLGFSDGQGKVWRQPAATTGLSWNQIATVCPRDGLNPCQGTIGSKDLSGWVWASSTQVLQLMSLFDPAILTSPTGSSASVMAGIGFSSVFTPTQWFANTYSSSQWVGGWTSSKDANGLPIAGGGGWSTPPHAGGIGIGPVTNPDEANPARGVFLWRADGSDGRGIDAVDDSGSVAEPGGTVVVANVLANDVLAGEAATVGTVTLTQLASTSPHVSLDPSDGSVDVALGAPAGAARLDYRICETANPSNCDQAAVAVTITGTIIDAVDDQGGSKTTGGTAVANVLANDSYEGVPVTLTTVSSDDAGIALDASGAVSVARGTAAGTYRLVYRLCEATSATNCDTAVVVVGVVDLVIDATDDQGGAPSNPGGTAIGSVLSNDRLDGAVARLGTVTLSQVSSTDPGVTLDLTDGSVEVQAGTAGGVHTLRYRICEVAVPGNCDEANAVVTVAPQTIVASKTSFSMKEGGSATFTVRLAQPPTGPVPVSVSYYAGTATVTAAPASLTFTPANWSTPVTVTVTAPKDSDKVDNAATIHLAATGLATVPVVIGVTDINKSSGAPIATITAPRNGATVSGVVDFTGTGTAAAGATPVEAKFIVDGNRIHTDANTTGSYRIPARWNTRTVANGWHVLELRVTDSNGKDGRMTVKVLVAN